MDALNMTQIIAEFGTTGLFVACVLIMFKMALPHWVASLNKLDNSIQQVNGTMQEVKSSQDKLLAFHTNGRVKPKG